MTRLLLATLCLFASAPAAVAQPIGTAEVKPAAPTSMLSYLDTDMRVGIKNVEGTASVLLYVYTEEDYETAQSVPKLGLNPATNPVLTREIDAYMTRNGLSDSSKGRVIIVPPRQIYGRIDSIGDDYLLIGLDADIKSEPNAKSRRRRIIPKSSIASIDLDAAPIRFITRPERKSTQTGDNH